jgi:hypothetical protein
MSSRFLDRAQLVNLYGSPADNVEYEVRLDNQDAVTAAFKRFVLRYVAYKAMSLNADCNCYGAVTVLACERYFFGKRRIYHLFLLQFLAPYFSSHGPCSALIILGKHFVYLSC